MADFSALKAAIQAAIRQNGDNEITGNIMQGILLSMVNTLGDAAINALVDAVAALSARVADGYMYGGIATPTSTPAASSGKVFYIATQAGTYTHYGSLVVTQGINILKTDNVNWTLEVVWSVDSVPTLGSNNLVMSDGVTQYYGDYEQNPEYIRVIVDSSRKFLEAIRIDGIKEFYLPTVFKDNVTIEGDIINEYLTNTFNNKVDKVAGKSLIDEDYASSQSSVENPEWLQAILDSGDKILEGIKSDGKKQVNLPIDTPSVTINHVENPEWLHVVIDSEGRILEGIDKDGKKHIYLLEMDNTPTKDSDLPVKSGGVYNRLEEISQSIEDIPTGISGVVLGSTQAPTDTNNNAVIEMATQMAAGLMSRQDKQKLDNIIPGGTINISGSGVTKNASAFGFLPTNDGDTNAAALQSCLNGGGYILVDIPGTYELSKSMLIDSFTEIKFAPAVFIRLVSAQDGNGNVRNAFINRGALDGEDNQYITIEGLNLDAGVYGGGDDISSYNLIGQRGHIAMKGVHYLTLKNIYITSSSMWYNIHIQEFEHILLEGIRIESTKDGIHLGVGKNFTIRDSYFKTDDDAIALNGHDYPTGTREFGWIENGRIENVKLANPSNGSMGRGIFSACGSWSDWQNGNSYLGFGDTCVSEGGVYTTYGTYEQGLVVSTQKPTHSSGVQTYSDGLTWIRMDGPAIYNAGLKNIVIDNIYLENKQVPLTFHTEVTAYGRSVYPGSTLPVLEDITMSNLFMEERGSASFFIARVPFKNVRFINCDYKVSDDGIYILFDGYSGVSNLLMSGISWDFNQGGNSVILNNSTNRYIDLKIFGSIESNMNGIVPRIINSGNVNTKSDIIIQNN